MFAMPMLLAAILSVSTLSATAQPSKLRPTDILILGDSQLAFGSGPALEEFFKDFSSRCGGLGLPDDQLRAVESMSVGILGVRATGLHM